MKALIRVVKVILLLLFFLIGLSFASINTTKVSVDLWIHTVELPLSLVVAVAVFIGVLLSSAYFLFPLVKRKGQIRYLSGKLEKMRQG